MPQELKGDPYRELRSEIDRIDRELLTLLNRRAEVAVEIGRLKRRLNEPIYVPERENAVLEGLARENPGPLPGDGIQHIFRTVIEEVRALEERHGNAV